MKLHGMVKLFIRIGVMVGVCSYLLVLTGCGGGETGTVAVKNAILAQEKRFGVIQSLGGAYSSQGATHLLKQIDGKNLYLKSTVVNLADKKYAGQNVELMGPVAKGENAPDLMTVNSIDIVESDTDLPGAAEDVPEWIDYDSANLSLSLKYRNDYKLSEKDKVLILNKTVKTADTPSVVDELGLATIQITMLSSDPKFDLAGSLGIKSDVLSVVQKAGFSKAKITQAGLDSYKKSSADGKKIDYYVNAGESYQISFLAGKDETLTEDQNMFFDIMSSLEFK